MSPLLLEVFNLAKMTKAAARKRLKEAKDKVKKVYIYYGMSAVQTADMNAIEKILDKCMKRLI